MRETQKKERDLRIDFFRGLALVFIFIDHIPDNSWAAATLRNFGFADASEVFVLLAGYSAGLAYWSTVEKGGFAAAFQRAGKRASEIYIWHIGVFIASALLLYSAARVFNNPDYVNNIAIAELAKDPVRTLAGALALFYQPNMMNILPMYVVLMAWLPFVLIMLRRSIALALAVSFAIWLFTSLSGLNLPTYQRGEGWYFNPFAWQLLFTTGAAASVLVRRMQARPRAEILIPASAYLLFAFLVMAPWVTWLPGVRLLPADILGAADKSYLPVWRFLHVLALAYVVAALVPKDAPWLKRQWAQLLQLCGRRSLEIFSLSTLLSFFGWIALIETGSSQVTMWVVNVAGIAIMGMTAWQMSRRTSSRAPLWSRARVQAATS
jgi:hypothetical protein